jgi:hypothetical protein
MTDELTCGFCRDSIGTINTDDKESLRAEVINHLKTCPTNPHAKSDAIVETYAFLLIEAYRRVAEIKKHRDRVASGEHRAVAPQ